MTVWFVGDGEEEVALRESVVIRGLSDVVQFLGYRRDPLDLIGAMDIVVLPSLSNEDSPFATIEAMALGKPVVATTVAGLKEQVVDGVTGFLVRPGDHNELAQRIVLLIESADVRRSLGEAGHERYLRYFSPDVFVARYLDLYQRS